MNKDPDRSKNWNLEFRIRIEHQHLEHLDFHKDLKILSDFLSAFLALF